VQNSVIITGIPKLLYQLTQKIMKKLLIATLLLLASNLLAQNKKAYYYDENMKPLSNTQYRSEEFKNGTLNINYETDTAIIYTRVIRENVGLIKPDPLKALRKDLETISGVAIDTANIIVINFYPGPDLCYLTGSKDRSFLKAKEKEYQKQLRAIGQVSQFYICSEFKGLERYKGIRDWKLDPNKRVEDTFFIYHYDCGSLVVIHPTGAFISYFGEYGLELTFEYIKILKGL
jgi:hypothetical protein